MPEADIAQALRAASARLAQISPTARLDAEVLMAACLGVSRGELLLHHQRAPVPSGFADLVERRLRHEPVAYLTGAREFFGLDFAVAPGVLIPRPDSEVLIEVALATKAGRPPARVLDLGTGSGALLLAALAQWPQAHGIGLERSATARIIAAANATRLGLAERAQIMAGDWTQPGWAEDLGRFDVVLANPPYIEADAPLMPDVARFEPPEALYAGPEGLDDYRRLLPTLPDLLNPGGLAVFEIGYDQAPVVGALARQHGLDAVLHRDLAGAPRALALTVLPPA